MTFLIKGTNPRDHVAEIAYITVRYLEMNSIQYSRIAQTLLNDVLTTIFNYGVNMSIHVQKFDIVHIYEE